MKTLPVYVPDGGKHDVLNIPLGLHQRSKLAQLCRQLLNSRDKFGTILAVPAHADFIVLLKSLSLVLNTNFRIVRNRKIVSSCLAANEKKPERLSSMDIQRLARCSVNEICSAAGLFFLCYLLFSLSAILTL